MVFYLIINKVKWILFLLPLSILPFILMKFDDALYFMIGRLMHSFETNTLSAGRIIHWSYVFYETKNINELLFGPQLIGLNTHNYWFHVYNLIGLVGVTFFLLAIFLILVRSVLLSKTNYTFIFFFMLWFILDTNVNTPLSQPYVQSIFVFLAVMSEKGLFKKSLYNSNKYN